MRKLFFTSLFIAAPLFSAGLSSCTASFDGAELTVENSHVSRKWQVSNGLLYATSLRNMDSGVEWLRPSAPPPNTQPKANFSTQKGKLGPVEAESLVATLTTGQTTYRLQIFPDARGVSIQTISPSSDALENLDLSPNNLKLTQVRLLDQTDIHNELVFEDEWLLHPVEPLSLTGNLFHIEDQLTGSGIILLKESPLPHARPIQIAADLTYEPGPKRLHFLGQGYRSIVLAYSGGRPGRIEALQSYQRQLRTFNPDRDARFLSNTWGDRSRDARINADFMAKEVEAGARLGVDAIQIDDGWQHGRTANSAKGPGVWNGFWAADPNFWDIDPVRFPKGLAPIVASAASHKMQFGLWFAPDSSNSFANWQRDAARLLELHQALRINYFKIDGVKAITTEGERNLRQFFDRVLTETHGDIAFDLDVTAEIRPGYFGAMDVGPIFVENRYTDFHRYWPHQTLRNLWKLAQYVDPLRLRMEVLNNFRNTQLYAGDPLQPAAYSPATLFATVMFSNPLGWFETSNLPKSYFDEMAPLVAKWKQERPALFSGTIIPIGEAPDGNTWTGFLSIAPDLQSGYALIFREANQSPHWQTDLPLLKSAHAVSTLAGSGVATLTANHLQVHIPATQQFLWLKF
jgi:alpha-galactosidase